MLKEVKDCITAVDVVQECSLIDLGVLKEDNLAVVNKAVNDMRQDVLSKSLVLAVYISKSQ